MAADLDNDLYNIYDSEKNSKKMKRFYMHPNYINDDLKNVNLTTLISLSADEFSGGPFMMDNLSNGKIFVIGVSIGNLNGGRPLCL